MLCAPSGGPESLLLAVCVLVLSALPGQSSLVTQELTDAPSPASPTPGLDLEFDPRTMTLRWSCQENATRATCRLSHREMGDIKVNAEAESCQCTFTRVALHRGATLKVSTTVDGAPVQEELPFSNPGAQGTAARNFSCAIYSAAFMNCTWAPGPAAPSDVQYSLYMRQLKANSESNETECPHYIPDSGTHRGCHLRDISKLKYRTFFLVNGTSRGTEIQFFDLILSTREMEQISPPDNISVQCNASHCVLQWNQPRTKTYLTYLDFQYQLGIRTQNTERARGDNSVINVSGEVHNVCHLPSPEPRGPHSLRIRAADSRGGPWGHWSRPVEFALVVVVVPLRGHTLTRTHYRLTLCTRVHLPTCSCPGHPAGRSPWWPGSGRKVPLRRPQATWGQVGTSVLGPLPPWVTSQARGRLWAPP
nr:granulocyte-macrophage colony-stimulating factor receptor subunit alpha-like isoform X2 [Marmota flaviventris]